MTDSKPFDLNLHVARLLREELGVPTVDADAISHAVLARGTFASRRVVAAFVCVLLAPRFLLCTSPR